MTDDDLTRFSVETGLCLPRDIAVLVSKAPWLEGSVERLITLNSDVRVAPTSWPEDHVVIGEDRCGNYWSVLRPDTHPPMPPAEYSAVWFYDHDRGTHAEAYPSIGAFLLSLEIAHPIVKVCPSSKHLGLVGP
jgi:hypothetical protein